MIVWTDDCALIKSVVTNPQLWPAVSEDGADPATWEPDLNHGWLAVYDPELIGFYSVRPMSGVILDIHPVILPQYRGEKAYRSAKEVLAWIFKYTEYSKVIAFAPFCHPNIKRFAMRAGMQVEGINTQSFRKNGVYFDQWMLGIHKQQFTGL